MRLPAGGYVRRPTGRAPPVDSGVDSPWKTLARLPPPAHTTIHRLHARHTYPPAHTTGLIF
ncbi:hypothetical protein [Acetobacter indonesiensis]|uniref:hypothetical protein n=1 Tax=Acetobacter indonesiensis TaxID=104101 RepID=UPI00117791CA|nr:hypothetical protein [Acetobacter indonesiensis]